MHVREKKRIEKPSANDFFILCEYDYTVKFITMDEDIVAAYRLRHEVFCDELRWVSGSERGLEVDPYDEKAVPFGVFHGSGNLAAYIRLVTAQDVFMIEKDFSMLVDPSHRIRKELDTAETSRVCVAPHFRNHSLIVDNQLLDISMLLFKGVYLWCIDKGIRYIYTVVELKMLRYLRSKGFPCALIGKPKTMPDGTRAAAVLMDWREFETMNRGKRPEVLNWFSQEKLSPCLSR